MIAGFEAQSIAALQYIFDQFGWFGLAGLMAFENAPGLTPSEIPLGLAGWILLAAHDSPLAMLLVGALYAALRSLAGSSITYWLVRLGGRPLLDRIARWVRIDPHHIQHTERLIKRCGPGMILFGRLVPGIRTLITIPAGLSRMSFLQFLAFTFIGAYIWSTIIIGVDYLIGHKWNLISGLVGRFTPWAVAGFVALIGTGWMIRWLIQRRMRLQPVYLKTYENEFVLVQPSPFQSIHAAPSRFEDEIQPKQLAWEKGLRKWTRKHNGTPFRLMKFSPNCNPLWMD